MKKMFLFGIISLLAITAVGCGKKGTINCTIDNKDSVNPALKYEIIIDYEGNKVTSAKGNIIYESAEIAKEQYSTLEDYAKEMDSKKNYALEGNKILNANDLNDILQLATGNINEKNKNKIIDGLKAAGYTCK